jgi:hypothetical protein
MDTTYVLNSQSSFGLESSRNGFYAGITCFITSVTQKCLEPLLRHWPQLTKVELIMVNQNLSEYEQHLKHLESSLREICESTLRAEQFSKHAWTVAMETFALAEDLRKIRLRLEQKECTSAPL